MLTSTYSDERLVPHELGTLNFEQKIRSESGTSRDINLSNQPKTLTCFTADNLLKTLYSSDYLLKLLQLCLKTNAKPYKGRLAKEQTKLRCFLLAENKLEGNQ